MAGDVRNSTRFGSHITRPLERKFIGCSTNGMRIGPWRKP